MGFICLFCVGVCAPVITDSVCACVYWSIPRVTRQYVRVRETAPVPTRGKALGLALVHRGKHKLWCHFAVYIAGRKVISESRRNLENQNGFGSGAGEACPMEYSSMYLSLLSIGSIPRCFTLFCSWPFVVAVRVIVRGIFSLKPERYTAQTIVYCVRSLGNH